MTTSLPRASVTISDESISFGSGADLIAIVAPTYGVSTPEMAIFASTDALLEEHDYSQGVALAALHMGETGLPVLYVAVPIATTGSITHYDRSGVTGTSVVTAIAGSAGVLEQVDATLTITEGGTVGTDQLGATLSLDGGHNTRPIRIGTANSHVIDYVGITLQFAAGTLAVGDVVRFRSVAPLLDPSTAGTIRALLATSPSASALRSILFVGDLSTEGNFDAVRAAVQAYETTDERFTLARTQYRDQRRGARALAFRGRSSGVSITFLGAADDTMTLASGTWADLGFTVGDTIVITGTASNNATHVIDTITGAALKTVGDLEAEVVAAVVNGYSTLVFAEAGDTVTRATGSWLLDGFHVGMTVSITGTASNNGTYTVATVTGTVLTLDDLTDETIGGHLATITATESKAAHRAAFGVAIGNIAGSTARRLDPAFGYAAKLDPITGYRLRRPAAWAASLREYLYDFHIPSWRVDDGSLGGWTLLDADNDLAEHDERVDGGILAIGATCLRSWNNEIGAFVALSMTRADPGSMLSRTHNMQVANVACTTVQRATQRNIGQVLEVDSAGRGTNASLTRLEMRIQKQLDIALGNVRQQGPRASSAVWTASRSDILNVPGSTINGVLELRLNATVERIATVVRVPTGG